MVEVRDPEAMELLNRLVESGHASLQDLQDAAPHPKLVIPSKHPTIATPLTIELGGTIQLFWQEGYFADFIGQNLAEEAFQFLERFFREEIRCSICRRNGKYIAGGPIEDGDDLQWVRRYDEVDIRSWKGSRDQLLSCRS